MTARFRKLTAAIWLLLGLLVGPAVWGATLLYKAPNATVHIGLPQADLEFENPLTGAESVLGYKVVDWRDADYDSGPPPWYDDWTVSHPGEIDGWFDQIWLRRRGHSASTTTTVGGTTVSIHLTGDDNDGIAQVQVDGTEVARLDMYKSCGPVWCPETALIIVRGLSNGLHTITVSDLGPGAAGFDDVHILGAAVLQYEADLKWVQRPVAATPTNIFYGWNEVSVYEWGPIAADDFVCTSDAPITAIRWWGSFPHWPGGGGVVPPLPVAFNITFWTDVPAGSAGEPFSHPGTALWTIQCTNFGWRFVGWDFDPRSGTYEACYEFHQTLQPQEYFRQPPGSNVLWISIAAVYQHGADFLWGWKTRPRSPLSPAPDDAVRIFRPTAPAPGMQYEAGEPIWWPELTNSWDLAFELFQTTGTSIPKWDQVPDLTPDGMDVNANLSDLAPPFLLADDFQCVSTGPLTDFTIWGSWWHDLLPGTPTNVVFTLSIHADVPSNANPPGFSMPGEILWMRSFGPGEFQWKTVQAGVPEGWMDPPQSYEFPGDTICHQYDFHVDPAEAFVQRGTPDQPVVYWLDVQAQPVGHVLGARFGWKTCPTNWNDDAVWVNAVEPFMGRWNPLTYPPDHRRAGQSADLAFRLASAQETTTLKWSQPPVAYNPPDAYRGWNEMSVHGLNQIVADDWACTNASPVTDLHWWGSFLGWGYSMVPEFDLPDAFAITIWTDVPAEPGGFFSHPGEVVWQILCTNYSVQFAGWDFDPRNPGAPPEACFRFDQDLLEREWFRQSPAHGTNIYWVSIAAVYFDQQFIYPWGWKTRPRNPNSLAPDDAVRVYAPTAPEPGQFYLEGEPIWWPEPTNSWDCAFALSTRQVPTDLDFGDAPDGAAAPIYPTLLANNGARHIIVPGVFLGNAVDAEPDGQPTANADGDDLNPPLGLDDEDGVSLGSPLVPGQPGSLVVVASVPGYINAWLDFGADGSWSQPVDQIFTNEPVAGTTTLTFQVPSSAVSGTTTVLRVRFCTVTNPPLAYAGPAPDGEVEDHPVFIEPPPQAEADLGDAPDSSNSFGLRMTAYPTGVQGSFPTVYQAGSPPYGPLHRWPLVLAWLGPGVSLEQEADIGLDQDGVNNLDPPNNVPNRDGRDDSLLPPLVLPHCLPTSIKHLITVAGPSQQTLFVNVWFDWNRDGDWNDSLPCPQGNAPEWAVQNQPINLAVLPGPFPMTFTNITPQFQPWHPQTGGPQEIWMRITLSEQPWPPAGGPAPTGGEGPVGGYEFGETEDYLIADYITEILDFGDAGDPYYPTLLANNGARHTIVPGFYLGSQVDAEPDGQPDPLAQGDDNNNDDEDGVIYYTLRPGQLATITVIASAPGRLDAWCDFQVDGSWAQPGDQIFTNVSLPGGTTTLSFQVPAYAFPGAITSARFRFSSVGNLPPDGPAPDGEVEDHAFRIEYGEMDLGDAPDSSNSAGALMTAYPPGGPPGVLAQFPTVYRAGSPPFGPIHAQPRAVAWLGPAVSLEAEADFGPDQDGVNNILPPVDRPDLDAMDDGVLLPLTLQHCRSNTFQYTVSVAAVPAGQLFVNVWFDWNRDGDWDDTLTCPNGPAPEWAVQNQPVPVLAPGVILMTTPPFLAWQPFSTNTPLWMRITLSEQQWPPPGGGVAVGGEGPHLGYQFGETEDYYLTNYVGESNVDFGDAPDRPYPTLLANNGAGHLIVPGIRLGARIDGEANGQPNPFATGDDVANLADEDGVVFATPLFQGQIATLRITASVQGWLDAWLDFGADGSWLTAGDQIFANRPLNAGLNVLNIPVPANAAGGQNTFARFRFSTTGGLTFTGLAQDGEVEDYRVFIRSNPPPMFTKWLQPPDLSLRGLDVLATGPKILADDFPCTRRALINGITIWGSWLDDNMDPNAQFLLGLWTDVPPDSRTNYSRPGQLLASAWFYPPHVTNSSLWRYQVRFYTNAQEGFFDPNLGRIIGADTRVWQYDFFPRATNWLQTGTPFMKKTYWLSVTAKTRTNTLFGWKTSYRRWQDDGVFGHVNPDWVPERDWRELRDPRDTNSLNLAFAIRTYGVASINKDFWNFSQQAADAIEVELLGSHLVTWHYDDWPVAWPNFTITYTAAGNTVLRWSGRFINPGQKTHIGFEIPGNHVPVVRWTWLNTFTGASWPVLQLRLIPGPIFRPRVLGFANDLAAIGGGAGESEKPLTLSALTIEYFNRPVPIDELNPDVTNRQPIHVEHIIPPEPPLTIPPGETLIVTNIPPPPPEATYAVVIYETSDMPMALKQLETGASTDFMLLPLDRERPLITEVTQAGGMVTIVWESIPGRSYRVQYKPTVDAPAWLDVPGDVLATEDTASKMVSALGSQLFFRVILLEEE